MEIYKVGELAEGGGERGGGLARDRSMSRTALSFVSEDYIVITSVSFSSRSFTAVQLILVHNTVAHGRKN